MLKNITLELSLKPFEDISISGVKRVAQQIFEQWMPLIRHSDVVSLLLWASDGSEILEYSGELGQAFEWAYWQGIANPDVRPARNRSSRSINDNPVKYRENPPVLDYQWLKGTLQTLRQVGKEMTNKPIRIGATFDPGPEFSISRFKYNDHPEICRGISMGPQSFVACNSVLHADKKKYAGFPGGIDEGTSFGSFFGRQCQLFLSDMGYDYIWFSNGFGFGLEAWGYKGTVFDGKAFFPEKVAETSTSILTFWEDFTAECPAYPVESRGSNMSAGIEISTDACPVQKIYEKFKPAPPVNSPWVPINGDFGLELLGWMSHIAQTPSDDFAYRFYTHDPWFLNSPWLDRYERQPYDIYLPMSIAKIGADGKAVTANSVNFLTIDDSYGNMPECVPNEVIPHVLTALQHAPDTAGPLMIVYPFEEYNKLLTDAPERLSHVFAEDWFIRGAINHGLPLNTVVSTTSFLSIFSRSPEYFRDTVMFFPTSAVRENIFTAYISLMQNGGKAVLYGSLADATPQLLAYLDIVNKTGLTGDLTVSLDARYHPTRYPIALRHSSVLSGGSLTECAANKQQILVSASNQEGEERVLATVCRKEGGCTIWIRAENCCNEESAGNIPVQLSAENYFQAEMLPRLLLCEFGYTIRSSADAKAEQHPVMTISRSRNSFFFSGFSPDTNVKEILRLPYGAPAMIGLDTKIVSGISQYSLLKSWRYECRVFVEQNEDSVVTVKELFPGHPSARRRIHVKGLKNATLRFFPETGCESRTYMINHEHAAGYIRLPVDCPEHAVKGTIVQQSIGVFIEYSNITGNVLFSW